jgi:hypothetical protein
MALPKFAEFSLAEIVQPDRPLEGVASKEVHQHIQKQGHSDGGLGNIKQFAPQKPQPEIVLVGVGCFVEGLGPQVGPLLVERDGVGVFVVVQMVGHLGQRRAQELGGFLGGDAVYPVDLVLEIISVFQGKLEQFFREEFLDLFRNALGLVIVHPIQKGLIVGRKFVAFYFAVYFAVFIYFAGGVPGGLCIRLCICICIHIGHRWRSLIQKHRLGAALLCLLLAFTQAVTTVIRTFDFQCKHFSPSLPLAAAYYTNSIITLATSKGHKTVKSERATVSQIGCEFSFLRISY